MFHLPTHELHAGRNDYNQTGFYYIETRDFYGALRILPDGSVQQKQPRAVWGADLYPLPVLDVSAGDLHTCAITSAPTFVEGTLGTSYIHNTIFCWGQNSTGQLGPGYTLDALDGVYTMRPVPFPVGVTAWGKVSAGAGFTCAISADQGRTNYEPGTAFCWGAECEAVGLLIVRMGRRKCPPLLSGCGLRPPPSAGSNSEGQLGDNSTVSRASPRNVPPGIRVATSWSDISAGGTFTAALFGPAPVAPTARTP